MTDTSDRTPAPPGWIEALAESEAELAAGVTVSGEAVHQELRDAITRLKTKRAGEPEQRAALRR
ncbi:MAG: hypothetical protein M0Z28_24595 [Rhodospirillales bacterium]|nr:hypothetical protein [Rhodospirillales bacterium]